MTRRAGHSDEYDVDDLETFELGEIPIYFGMARRPVVRF
jgi:hypothetical protein